MTPTQPLEDKSGVIKSWASNLSPVMAKNHWPGWRVLVSVEMVPGGPHLMILPLTASDISETVQGGGGGFEGGIWVMSLVDTRKT